jgi:hypothetical protein
MGQTSDPETLVTHQKLTPGNNPKILSNNLLVLRAKVSRNIIQPPVINIKQKKLGDVTCS